VVKNHLRHLTEYAIAWFQKLLDKYSKGRERKTEIRLFDRVEASKVALANVKLYMNREDGFIGTGLRKDEFIADCSDLDEIIVFREDGKCIITKVADKNFVGKGILHAQVFKKGDERTIYNLIYKDGASGISYVKRFAVVGVTRDKEYDLTKGSKGSKVLYFTANPNGEAEIVTILLKPHTKLKKLQFDLDYADIAIKGRGSQGNIVSKYPIKKVLLKSKGVSTLSGLKIWYDDLLRRLNVDGRGKYLGEFDGDDKILQVHRDGWYELSTFELSNHFDADLILIQKFDAEKPFTVVQYEGKAKNHFIKRFVFEAIGVGKKLSLISEENGSKFLHLTSNPEAMLKVDVLKGKTQTPETLEIILAEFIDVKGIRANGNRLTQHDVQNIEIFNHEEEELIEEGKAVTEEEVTEDGDSETDQGADDSAPVDEEEIEPADVPELKVALSVEDESGLLEITDEVLEVTEEEALEVTEEGIPELAQEDDVEEKEEEIPVKPVVTKAKKVLVEKTISDEAIVAAPVVEKAIADTPAGEPVVAEVAPEPIVEESISPEPIAKEVVVKEPVVKKKAFIVPKAVKTISEQPVTEQLVVEEQPKESLPGVAEPLAETPEPLTAAVEEKAVAPEKPKKAWNDSKPVKKITLEITNPDDVDIDNKGQLGLF
jgi:topoisomerase-4 subunit A